MSDFTISFRDSEDFNVNLNQDTELDVDMGTVYIPNIPAVLYEEQELDEDQQEQARDNIGAIYIWNG